MACILGLLSPALADNCRKMTIFQNPNAGHVIRMMEPFKYAVDPHYIGITGYWMPGDTVFVCPIRAPLFKLVDKSRHYEAAYAFEELLDPDTSD